MSSSLDYGAIIPMVQVAGTATRRAVEATWLTASNPKVISTRIFPGFISGFCSREGGNAKYQN